MTTMLCAAPRAVVVIVAAASLAACAPKPSAGWSGYAEGEYVYVASAVAGTLARLDAPRGGTVEAGAPLFALDAVAEDAARRLCGRMECHWSMDWRSIASDLSFGQTNCRGAIRGVSMLRSDG